MHDTEKFTGDTKREYLGIAFRAGSMLTRSCVGVRGHSVDTTAGREFAQHESFVTILAALVGLGLAFQTGHFIEHAVQFGVWVGGQFDWVAATFCGRDVPYMSPPVTAMVRVAGAWMLPQADAGRQMMVSMEVLHLIGNFIFLTTIAGAHYLMPSKWTRWALYIEGAHLCEHLALTLSAIYIGKPIGISTLFGDASYYLGQSGAVGYRVTWHFALNLLPMPFVMIGMLKHKAATALNAGAPVAMAA